MNSFKSKAARTNINYQIARQVIGNGLELDMVRRLSVIEQLLLVMESKRIRNKDLADRMGMSESGVSRILQGKQNLTLSTMYKLADSVEEKLIINFG